MMAVPTSSKSTISFITPYIIKISVPLLRFFVYLLHFIFVGLYSLLIIHFVKCHMGYHLETRRQYKYMLYCLCMLSENGYAVTNHQETEKEVSCLVTEHDVLHICGMNS